MSIFSECKKLLLKHFASGYFWQLDGAVLIRTTAYFVLL
jgi:hypothetical protein